VTRQRRERFRIESFLPAFAMCRDWTAIKPCGRLPVRAP
jgi:hypothetical protein